MVGCVLVDGQHFVKQGAAEGFSGQFLNFSGLLVSRELSNWDTDMLSNRADLGFGQRAAISPFGGFGGGVATMGGLNKPVSLLDSSASQTPMRPRKSRLVASLSDGGVPEPPPRPSLGQTADDDELPATTTEPFPWHDTFRGTLAASVRNAACPTDTQLCRRGGKGREVARAHL